MPNMVIPNVGAEYWLAAATNPAAAENEAVTVELFSNDYAPSVTDVKSDYTGALFTGYSPVTVARSTFGAPTATGGVATTVSSVTPAWSCTGGGGQTVYGWFAYGASSGVLLAAQAFSTPSVLVPGTTESIGPFTMVMGNYP